MSDQTDEGLNQIEPNDHESPPSDRWLRQKEIEAEQALQLPLDRTERSFAADVLRLIAEVRRLRTQVE